MADKREAMASAERAAIAGDMEILKGMENSAEVAAALQARQARLDDLARGATPRGYEPSRELGQSAIVGGVPRMLNQEQIHDIFDFYANFGRSAVMTYQDSLDSFMFMKFAKECPGLTDGGLTKTEVDLIFTKAKPKFERRLDFEHFLDALAAIAERKYADYTPADGLRLLISNHLVPLYETVQAEMKKTGDTEIPLTGVFKRLYDVRSYTGVYAERFRSGDGRINGEADNRPGRRFGGSTNTGSDEVIHDISVLMRPNLARGGTMMAPSNHALLKRDPAARSKSPSQSRIHSPRAGGGSTMGSPRRAGSVSGDSFYRGFASPAGRPGTAPTPASTPATGLGSSAAGLGSGAAGIDVDAFKAAMARAQAGDVSQLASLTQTLASIVQSKAAGEPSVHTPAAAAGGREAAALRSDIAHLQERLNSGEGNADEISAAIQERSERLAAVVEGHGSGSASASGHGGHHHSPARSMAGRSVATGAGAVPALTQAQIKEVFEFYANFGRSAVMTYQESLDSFMFMKFAKETPDLMDRRLNVTEIDLIFMKAKPKFERRLHFSHFLDALAAIAERKYPDYSPADGLRLLIGNHLAPLYETVQAEMSKTGDKEVPLTGVFKKLYDVRSYTGVYAERFRSGDGRINGEADNRPGRQFSGSTNTGTDEVIHDISVLMRPNLKSGTMMANRPAVAGGTPRRPATAGSPRRNTLTSPAVGGSFDGGRSVAGSVRSRAL